MTRGTYFIRTMTHSLRDPHRKEQVAPALQPITAVTHVRLKMKGATASRSGGALRIYDVAINAPDPSARQESGTLQLSYSHSPEWDVLGRRY